jgi:hypothetical protein
VLFFVPPERAGARSRESSEKVIIVIQQQRSNDVSIDDIPVDVANTQSGEVDPAEVPEEIESITREIASEHPPTNPLVVLKAARWWYIHVDVDDDTERSKREVEAEAVAYVVGRYCGLDTSGSAFYLAAWESEDPEVVRDRLGRISTVSNKLIELFEDGA